MTTGLLSQLFDSRHDAQKSANVGKMAKYV